jgi:hypothetical protein
MRNTHPTTRRGIVTKRRRAPWLGAFIALVLAMAGLTAQTAMAADGPFSIDGNVPDAGATELADLSGNVKELGPLNSNTTKIGVIHNDALPTLGETNPNAQVDLRRAWLDTERDTAAPNHDWLYFAWERDNNTGSGFIAYEFMQNPAPAGCAYDTATTAQLIANCNPWANRKAGDFVILWDQQGGSKDLYLRTWSGTGSNLTLGAPTLLNAAVSQAAYRADGFRGEAAVDLTATIFGGSTACRLFANTIPSTVTGNSDTADYKDTILRNAPPISNCTSTTVTTPKDGAGDNIPAGGLSIGDGVVAVKDSAVVDIQGGTSTPTGSVAFSLCKVDDPGLCTTGGTSVGETDLTGTEYPETVVSPTAYVSSVGRYCWRAEFSGDSANGIPGSSDSSASECFTVNPVTPTLATTAGPDINPGQELSDKATLSGTATQPADPVINLTGTGGSEADGTITFKLYGPNDCETVAYTSEEEPVPVEGDGTYDTPDPQFKPTEAGTYHWVAEYSGDSPNTNGASHNTECTDENEDVVVSNSTTVTTPKDGTGANIPAGGLSIGTGVVAVKDSAVVDIQGGTATPTGSVAFSLCKVDDPGLCTTGGTSVGETDLTGATYPETVVSPTAYVTSVGRYCWRAEFSGDSDNGIPGSSDSSASECFTVNPVTPTLATTAGPDVNLGQAVSDTATLSGTVTKPADPVINLTGDGGDPAGGTITFKLYGPNDCETVAYESPTVAVTGNGSYASPQFTPTEVGTYHWVAVYSGSLPNTNGADHNTACDDANEDVVVNTVASMLKSDQMWLPNDSVTVSADAGGDLDGTVSFDRYATADCTGDAIYSTTAEVSGASPKTVSTSNTNVTATASGDYSWKVSYDSDNQAQRDIPASCEETSSLTIDNGDPVSSSP